MRHHLRDAGRPLREGLGGALLHPGVLAEEPGDLVADVVLEVVVDEEVEPLLGLVHGGGGGGGHLGDAVGSEVAATVVAVVVGASGVERVISVRDRVHVLSTEKVVIEWSRFPRSGGNYEAICFRRISKMRNSYLRVFSIY